MENDIVALATVCNDALKGISETFDTEVAFPIDYKTLRINDKKDKKQCSKELPVFPLAGPDPNLDPHTENHKKRRYEYEDYDFEDDPDSSYDHEEEPYSSIPVESTSSTIVDLTNDDDLAILDWV